MAPGYRSHPQYISIHALREEGDAGRAGPEPAGRISIHALREEGDTGNGRADRGDAYFYPRPPRGGRRIQTGVPTHDLAISIHALREEGDTISSKIIRMEDISIHALREEGDLRATEVTRNFNISIHALREEGDQARAVGRRKEVKFLSTPSARRATL